MNATKLNSPAKAGQTIHVINYRILYSDWRESGQQQSMKMKLQVGSGYDDSTDKKQTNSLCDLKDIRRENTNVSK